MALIDKLTAIADAARAKTGGTELLTLDEIAAAIGGISGGGNAIQIGQETPSPNFINLFYALEHGTAATGTFTLASPLSRETLIFSSGLPALNGIMLVNTDRTKSYDQEGVWFSLGLLSDGALLFGIVQNTVGTNTNGIIIRGSWRVDGGDFYVKPTFAGNNTYATFRPRETYRWVAW